MQAAIVARPLWHRHRIAGHRQAELFAERGEAGYVDKVQGTDS
jgi:hypothetical protein